MNGRKEPQQQLPQGPPQSGQPGGTAACHHQRDHSLSGRGGPAQPADRGAVRHHAAASYSSLSITDHPRASSMCSRAIRTAAIMG